MAQKKVGFSNTSKVQADRLIINNGLTASINFDFQGNNDLTFKLPTADGVVGMAIITDGNGNLSFGTVSGAGNVNGSGTTPQHAYWTGTQSLGASQLEEGTGQLVFPSGTVASPGITFKLDTDTGVYRSGSGQVAIAGNGQKIAEFTSTGALIGQVNYTSAQSGTAGFVLSIDSFGNTYWAENYLGATGATGISGTNGTSGTSGQDGTSGVNGTSGTSGQNGSSGTSGAQGATGSGGTIALYGSFLDTTTQTNSGATATNTLSYNTTESSNGISIVSNSRITISSQGTYNIQFSAQVEKTDSGDDEIDFWLSKNGTDLSWSNTRLQLPGNNAETVASWNWLVGANDNDYYEIKWASPDVDMRILAVATQSDPTRPAIPSVILSVSQITYTQIGPTGSNGSSGSSGTSGVSGSSGSSGTSGANGSSGTSGTNGSSGTSGANGSSGTSGANGSSGTSGSSGSSGSSGLSGSSGSSGSSGTAGTSGTFAGTFFETFITDGGTTASLLENNSNWAGVTYSGTPLVNTLQGQRHWDNNYVYEAVDDNIWVRYSITTQTGGGGTASQTLAQVLALGNTSGTYSIGLTSGSQTSPSLFFQDDTDTGLYRYANNGLSITTGGEVAANFTGRGVYLQPGGLTALSLGFIGDNDTGLYRNAANELSISTGGIQSAIFATNSVEVPDGVETLPGISFISQPNMGFYRPSANIMIASVAGVAKFGFLTNFVLNYSAAFRNQDGSAAGPSYTFQNDTDTGLYRAGVNTLGIAAGGATAAIFTTTSLQILNGNETLPSISFISDTTTGIFRRANLELNFTVNGAELLRLDSDTASAKVVILNNGTPTAVSLGINDTNTGLYRPGTDQLGISGGGATSAVFDNTGIKLIDGSLSNPSLSFINDTDTGLYRVGSGRVGVVANGLLFSNFLSNETDIQQNRAQATASNNMFYHYALATSGGEGRWKFGLLGTDNNVFRLDRWSSSAFASRGIEMGTTYSTHFGNGLTASQFDGSTAAGETRLLLWDVDAGTLKRVSVGAADSGGTGYKVLRIPN